MWFQVDPRSNTPLYQQLIDGVKEAVAKQILTPGERLPPVREVASLIAINPNTIAKAYQELEREGIIETFRGRGTFIAERQNNAMNLDKEVALQDLIEKLLVEAYYLEIEQDELLQIIEKQVKNWYRMGRETKNEFGN
ncbi:GntR family transcriptional regulator [Bacillus sp. CGMCC 1.16607]|uniref:GntR family transcriptional regulator n=1 Tax=Bacillus sp. CGMCC 1.16607 TaxID=3351842 RepID=UPI00363AFAEA